MPGIPSSQTVSLSCTTCSLRTARSHEVFGLLAVSSPTIFETQIVAPILHYLWWLRSSIFAVLLSSCLASEEEIVMCSHSTLCYVILPAAQYYIASISCCAESRGLIFLPWTLGLADLVPEQSTHCPRFSKLSHGFNAHAPCELRPPRRDTCSVYNQ
jgi:hypothetical protein